jgi:hypothetical protein
MFAGVPANAAPPNMTGSWTVQQSGLNGSSTGKLTITQSGAGIVGQSAAGVGITGTFVTDSQINGKWQGPGGAGWLTVYVTPNGHSLNGTWGYNGRPANGSYTANKFLPPSPITAAGTWKVAAAGGSTAILGPMVCTQSGPSALCHVGTIIINGKFRTADKVRATWTNGSKSGWFSFWFNGDNNSFNGQWGVGKDTSPPQGRVVGQRTLG